MARETPSRGGSRSAGQNKVRLWLTRAIVGMICVVVGLMVGILLAAARSDGSDPDAADPSRASVLSVTLPDQEELPASEVTRAAAVPEDTDNSDFAGAEVTSGRLPGGVTIAGTDVGGKTGSAAVRAVEKAAAECYQQSLVLRLPDRTVTLTAQELQASMDASAAVARAQAWDGSGGTLVLAGDVSFAESALRERLEAIREEIEVPAGETVVNCSDNWLFITIGSAGTTLDVDAVITALRERLCMCDMSDLSVEWTEVRPESPDMEEVSEQYCTEPVNAYYDETTGEIVRGIVGWQFDIEEAERLADTAIPGSTVAVELVETNPEIVYNFLASLGSMSELAKYTRDGQLEDVEPATYEGYPDELSSFRTEYSNNPNRTTNLIKACQAIDGTVLQPGETFSFNGTVGERTAEKGFKEAVAYVSGENATEIGGGVCQVASTIYNAVLLANLEVVERWAHVYEVHYCDPGLDATVYWDAYDFQFRNTTDDPILIEAAVSGGYVNIRLMGTDRDDNYVVMTSEILGAVDHYKTSYKADSTLSLNEAAVYQGGSDGYTVRTYRNLYDSDDLLLSSTPEAYSNYVRRDRVVLVASGSPYLS